MTYSAEVLADTPLAYWRLGDTVGSASMADSSGNARPGTFTGNAVLGETGTLGGDADTAVTTNGTAATVASAAWMNVTAAITIECIVVPDAIQAHNQAVFARDKSGTDGPWRLQINTNGGVNCYLWTDTLGDVQSANGIITPGVPHHLAMTYANDGGGATLYVNGAEAATLAKTGAIRTSGQVGTSAIYLGNWEFGNGAFVGKLDEFAIYNTKLSAARIKAHYDAALFPGPSGDLAVVLPATAVALSGSYVAPPPAGSLTVTLPALTGALAGGYVVPPVESSDEFANDGYNYTGTARVFYEPPIAEPPPSVVRTKVKRVHSSIPAPTLVNGRPTW